MDYNKFLATKKHVSKSAGLKNKIKINSQLFDFQKDITTWALRIGKAAIFADCGLGKTPMQLEWASQIPGNVLILAPLAVSSQTCREGKKFNIKVKYCRKQEDVSEKITIANYEMLEKFDPGYFNGIVLDECFPPDTLIDVFDSNGFLTTMPIKNISIGDKIFNANEEDYVKKIYKRQINRAIQININGRNITSSENHPYFTSRGWKSAQDLQTGDYIMATESAVRLVRQDFSTPACSKQNDEILRAILFSEMADECSGIQSKSPQSGSGGQARKEKIRMVQEREPKGDKRIKENSGFELNGKSRNTKKTFIEIAGDKASSFRAWGEWTPDDIAAANNEGCIVKKLDCGISYITGKTSTGFSHMLQSRLRESRIKNSDRNRRDFTPEPQKNRPKERQKIKFFRVESVEVLELGHPELEKYRDETGNIYFYDIKAKQHPSFSINGCLVHNSSILKSYTGIFRNTIIESFKNTNYKLACTATPAPNDYMELGNHSEFLNVMSRQEMLSMFFVHDGGEVQKWRLKGHAEDDYWKWLCSWAVTLRKPADLGYDDKKFKLPKLNIHKKTTATSKQDGYLFPMAARTLQERVQARRETTEARVLKTAELINESDESWLVWCNLNKESEQLKNKINDAVQISGSDSVEAKEKAMLDFVSGKIKKLITKPSIAGFGMNFQHCHNVAFVGLSDSYEQFYQAVRRCWRFGQKQEVNCHIITADIEGEVVKNIERKERDAQKMAKNMVKHMQVQNIENLHNTQHQEKEYKPDEKKSTHWEMHLGDCVQECAKLKTNSIDYSVFSPPFASLYTYSDSDRDMGNCKNTNEFFEHFRYLVKDLFRVLRPGRVLSFHCMNLPTSKVRNGYIGLVDFRGQLIKLFQECGFIFVSEVCIWKNPVVAMQRTKSKGLLHKQVVKDSVDSRQGIPDYLVTMKKPGENENPVVGELDHFSGDMSTFQSTGRLSIDIWERYASPVWMDINPSNTLQRISVREHKDERHIVPLQLEVIHRALQLWTNENDLVLSPFAGIGSEGYEAIKMNRRFIGIELKKSYYEQACKNLHEATIESKTNMLIDI